MSSTEARSGSFRSPDAEPTNEMLLSEAATGAQAILLFGSKENVPQQNTPKNEILQRVAGAGPARRERINNGSLNEREERWKDVPKEKRMGIWRNEMNGFLDKYKNDPAKELEQQFLKKLLKRDETNLDDVEINADKVYDTFMRGDRAGDVEFYVEKVLDQYKTSQEINANRDLIVALGKIYGGNSAKVAELLMDGIKNINEQPEAFVKSANNHLTSRNRFSHAWKEQRKADKIIDELDKHGKSWKTKHPEAPHTVFKPQQPQTPAGPDNNQGREDTESKRFVASAGAASEKDVDKGIPNQDAYFSNPEKGVFGAFDGVGSYGASAKASQGASRYLEAVLSDPEFDTLSLEDAKLRVKDAMQEANKEVHELAIQHLWEKLREEEEASGGNDLTDDEILAKYSSDEISQRLAKISERLTSKGTLENKMATTAAVVKILQDKAIISHVGDSRIYHLRKNEQGMPELVQLTLDDTPMNKVLDTAEAKYIQEEKNKRQYGDHWEKDYLGARMITLYEDNPKHKYAWNNSADFSKKYPFIDGKAEVPLVKINDSATDAFPDTELDPKVESIDIQPGDRLIITSDGVHDGPTSVRMQEILTDPAYQDPDKAAQALVAEGQKENGDDATAVVINI